MRSSANDDVEYGTLSPRMALVRELAIAVRRRRKALGMNQTDLSLLAGCGRLFVSELERGKQTLRLDKLLSVLEVLGLNLTLTPGRGPLIVAEDLRAPYDR